MPRGTLRPRGRNRPTQADKCRDSPWVLGFRVLSLPRPAAVLLEGRCLCRFAPDSAIPSHRSTRSLRGDLRFNAGEVNGESRSARWTGAVSAGRRHPLCPLTAGLPLSELLGEVEGSDRSRLGLCLIHRTVNTSKASTAPHLSVCLYCPTQPLLNK